MIGCSFAVFDAVRCHTINVHFEACMEHVRALVKVRAWDPLAQFLSSWPPFSKAAPLSPSQLNHNRTQYWSAKSWMFINNELCAAEYSCYMPCMMCHLCCHAKTSGRGKSPFIMSPSPLFQMHLPHTMKALHSLSFSILLHSIVSRVLTCIHIASRCTTCQERVHGIACKTFSVEHIKWLLRCSTWIIYV